MTPSRVVVFAVAACGGDPLVAQPSPSGAHTMVPSVEAGLVYANITGPHAGKIATHAGDQMKWAIGWFDDQTIVLESSDIGTYAWHLTGDRWVEDTVDGPKCRRAHAVFAAKYDRAAYGNCPN
ncbi:MAG: hypothetical protein ABI867_00525 [Kofleriaceae bacterium]